MAFSPGERANRRRAKGETQAVGRFKSLTAKSEKSREANKTAA